MTVTALLVTLPGPASAETTLHVPGDYPTIQSAIDASVDGDTVVVGPGTYDENIDFLGKAITLRSSGGPELTIIDGGLRTHVVRFSLEGRTSVLRGFTIQHGRATASGTGSDGGGILIDGGSPRIVGNIITENEACGMGGGIAVRGSPLIKGNVISENGQFGCSGGIGGGGIGILGESQAQIFHNDISDNSWGSSGGGIAMFSASEPEIRGNLITGNQAGNVGDGIDIVNYSNPLIVGNLIAGNDGQGMYVGVPFGWRGTWAVNNTIADNGVGVYSTGYDAQALLVNNILVGSSGQPGLYCDPSYDGVPPILRFNNVFSARADAYGGACNRRGQEGNISRRPRFVDSAQGDYHLQPTSPSIDAGTNDAPGLPPTDIDGDPRIVGGVVDQGMDEFVPGA